MTVSLTFSTTSSLTAPPIYLPQDAGTVTTTVASTSCPRIYIRHNGVSSITALKYYMIPYAAGVYRGTSTAQEDFDQLIAWGDYFTVAPASIVPVGTHGVLITVEHGTIAGIRTGVGNSLANAVTFDDGVIAHDGIKHFDVKVSSSPSGYGLAGTKYFDLMFTYTYTT